jgi:ribosomal protein L3 glutamine methyltransferase
VTELQTIRDFLRYAVSMFHAAGVVHGHGTTSVVDEAAFIILETLHLPVDDINPWLDARLLAEECSALHDVITARVRTRKPAAYLLKKTYMHGIPFFVDERVIIPRSYIGELMMKGDITSILGEEHHVDTLLDLCTGSSCLAVLAAQVYGDAKIDATDISADALDVARINIKALDLAERISIFQGHLFAPLGGKKYDLIIANPPYVARAEVEAFPPEYAAEPQLAHLGGTDGFDLVREIIRKAPTYLNAGGALVCEIGTGRDVLDKEFANLDLMWLDTEESEGEVFVLRGKGREN